MGIARTHVRRIAATTALVAGAAVGLASSASADHVADVFVDSGDCRMGMYPSGIGVDLWTTDIKRLTTKDGAITGYVCRFDVPERFGPEETDSGVEWLRPGSATVITDFWCYMGDDGFVISEKGRFVLTPSGEATLSCRL